MKSLERQLQTSLAIILFLTLVGLVIIANLSTKNLLGEFVTSRLALDAERLFDTTDVSNQRPRVRQGKINPVYSTPESGRYYVVSFLQNSHDPISTLSPSLQGGVLPQPDYSQLTFDEPLIKFDMRGPSGEHLIVWSKLYRKNNKTLLISVTEDMSHFMKNRKHFSLLFFFIGVVGFLLILMMQRFVIHRLFKHLESSREEIKQIETGERKQLSENVPAEIYPLVKEFNQSLSQMQKRMKRSRNALGNLTHALKTPLSVLIQQLDADQVDIKYAKKQAERIRQLTERELKRARMAGLGNTTQRFNPREEIPTLISVLKQAHQKENLVVNVSISDSVTAFGDREDLLELLGNLLDNAFKWAKSEVSCSIDRNKSLDKIILIIEDDGENIDSQTFKQIEQRGIRLDENVDGHGLGLAICKDIVALYAGSIRFGRSDKLGGFLVEVQI